MTPRPDHLCRVSVLDLGGTVHLGATTAEMVATSAIRPTKVLDRLADLLPG